MSISSTHPSYASKIADWQLMRDAYEGEGAVKAKGVKYLPATPGQVLDGALKGDSTKPGAVAYASYKLRAVFPDYVSEAVERHIGMMHSKPATFDLPDGMADMIDKATIDGEGLAALLRRINEQQLVTGRLGLMLDLPAVPVEGGQAMPYIALYCGEAVRNWDNSDDHLGVNALTLVVLDESGPVMDPATLEWNDRERYRVLRLVSAEERLAALPAPALDDGVAAATVPNDATEVRGAHVYMQGVFQSGDTPSPAAMMTPMYRGAVLEQVPFVFINSKDIVPQPDNPPLLGLGRTCMTIYRGEADYRHTLFMQSQDTLVTIGTVRQDGEQVNTDEPLRVGAGAHIGLDINGDAKYIGIGAEGIDGQRESLRDDRKEADAKSGTLTSPSAGKQESGDALTTRVAAQTASLTQIATTGAAGLQNILRIAAAWMGFDAEKVVVTPNLEFETKLVTAQEITQLMAARTMGAPLSLESIHGVMVDRGLTSMEYQAELDVIAEEDLERAKRVALLPQPPAPPAPAPAPGKPGGAPTPAPAPAGRA